MAQKLFVERGGVLPKTPVSSRLEWPHLAELMPAFAYVDYALAQHLLAEYPHASENAAALICYLSFAARSGHICIKVNESQLIPHPEHICEGEIPAKFASMIKLGALECPEALITDVKLHSQGQPTTPLCRHNDLFYLQRYWCNETSVLNNFHKIIESQPAIVLNKEMITNAIDKLCQENKLLPEQAAAIRLSLAKSLSIISGGPGTGKTYTAGELIKIYWSAMDASQREKCEIALAAPTGKAAANLQKSLRRAVGQLTHFPDIQAKTLHALLGIRGASTNRQVRRLEADLILIDESSMIDVQLMSHLFAAIKPGARLIFLGDRHQLPPVSAGMLFADLINYPVKCCQELTTCLRAELKSIVDIATAINTGDAIAVHAMLNQNIPGISKLKMQTTNVRLAQQEIAAHALPHFHKCMKHTPQEALEAFNRYRVLSPLRQGPFGVDALNALFAHKLLQMCKHDEWFIAPILLVANDPRQDYSNGEVGILVRRLHQGMLDVYPREGDYALFPSKDESGVLRRVPALLLPKYEFAYCLSVHKSQGSEFDHVTLLMPEGVERFGREVLYTAVTRAKKQLEIWGSDSVLSKTIDRQSHRLSGVIERYQVSL